MLKITSLQMEILNVASMNRYKAKLCQHLKDYDPLLCQAAGPEAIKTTVDSGLERARQCGFTLNGPIRTYLETMLALGGDFDRDPQYAWLTPWLRPQEHLGEMDQARYLRFHIVRYLDDVQGNDGRHGIEALKKAQQVTHDQLIEIGSHSSEKALDWLQSLHPLKCQFIGLNALSLLIKQACKEAVRAGLHSPESIPLVLGLMFTFGSGILHDPLYPWVTRTLASFDEKENTHSSREERLLRRSKTYLKKMLQQSENNAS